MTALTRGPLPARVYWTRRVMVIGTALLLVFGIGRVLVGGSDGSSTEGTPTAVQAAADPTSDLSALPMDTETRKTKPKEKKTRTTKAPVLASPEGPCADTDIAVTPSVRRSVAGESVFFVLELRTVSAAACTWRVDPDSLTVKVTSGDDDIWSSRECPRSIPTRNVVVRNAVSTKVGVRWSGRRSDRDCTRLTEWALPGWYHVDAAALAGEPSDVQFRLEAPERPVITQSPKPDRNDAKTKPRDKPHDNEVEQKQR